MNLIQPFVEVLLVASGIFFLTAALLDGRRAPRQAGEPKEAHVPGADRGPATLVPRPIRRSALD